MFKVNHTKIRNLFEKAIVYLLIIILLGSTITVPVEAAMTITKNNSQAYNQEILNTLTSLLGSEAEAKTVLESMYKLGLLDGEGELVTASINVDGVEMTLDQIRELFSEGVDLNKIVTVDGTPITLGNLKIMLQIEDEIQRIKDTYFNEDITLNDAQKMALSSLREQIETTGIRMLTAGPTEIQFPAGINHDIYMELDTTELVCDNGSGEKSVSAVLKDKDGNPLTQAPNYDISISYRFVDGSAKRGTNYSGSNGTLTFEANGPASKTITFNILNDTSRFEGQKIFLLQYYNPHNIKLKEGIRAAQKQITINNSFIWPALNNIDISVETGSSTKLWDSGKHVNWQKVFVIPDNLVEIMMGEDIYSTLRVSFKNTGSSLSNAKLHLVLGNDMDSYLYSSEFPFEIPEYLPFVFDMGTLSKNSTFTATVYNNEVNEIKWAAHYMWQARDPHPEYGGEEYYYSGGCFYIEMPNASRDLYTGSEGIPGIYNIKITDEQRPMAYATAQEGAIFEYGHTVPINVYFDEPVNLTGVSMTVNGRTLYPEEVNTKSSAATFLYEIDKMDYTFLEITSITGAKDLIGNNQYEFDMVKLENIIKDTVKYHSFTNPSVSTTTDGGDITGEVSIDLSADTELTQWLDNEAVLNYDEKLNKWKVPSLCASVDGGNTKISLYVDSADKPTKLIGTFDVEPNPNNTNVTRAIEFYLDPVVGSSSNHSLWIGPYATYTVPFAVFLEDKDFYITHNFPEDNIVFAEDNTAPRLEYTVTNPNASWRRKSDFIWSSSNPAVATIDEDGFIYFTGTSGKVSFTLTALNGNVGKDVTKTSEEWIVKVGLKPFLNIPTGTNNISIKSGDNAQVRWISNLIAKNDEYSRDAEFNIQVFTADYSSGDLTKGDSVYSTTVRGNTSTQISSYAIPAQYLTGVSVIGKYSYIVEVSSDNPYKEGEVLKATAYIYISSRPAIVKLQKLNSYFITDSTSQLPISWILDYYDAINEAEFEFSITNNSNNEIIHRQKTTATSGGSYTLSIPKVKDGFKDVYTVMVKAKNSLDLTWSYDSFVLYVYSDDALKVWINGKTTDGTYTMSNIPQIKSMTSEEILALKRDIYLKDVISINYGDYAWGQISDQIKWQSSDSSIAMINYKQGTIYDNIENYTYTSYRPSTEFLLTGLKDGTARIKATHAATNSTEIVDVKVETLKDKLYLFQIYPKAKTTLTYVNGKGESCTVETNSNGELALFEESGIKSEVYMKSTSGGKEYMGTLYKGLVSSEKDYTKLELYPVNTFYLTEIATVELYFKNPDGTPFSGSAILRGGVYKEGEYCPGAKLNEKNGCEDQTITIDKDGKFTVKMDSSQFWVDSFEEGLRPSDKLELICELRYPDDTYYPNLLYIDLSYNPKEKVRVGDINFKVDRVSEEDINKPFIAIQKVDFGFESGRLIDIRGFKGKIGPGQTSEKLTLQTTVLWWGEDDFSKKDNHDLLFKDQYGFIPINQLTETLTYPFSTIMGTRNTFVLDRSTLKGWMNPKVSRGMNLIMTDAQGDVYDKKMPFRIINMYDIDKVQEDDSLFFLLETMSTGFGADAGSMGLGDAVVGDGLSFLSTIGIGNTSNSKLFNMVVSPTIDPTVFMAFIGVNAGNMSNDNVTGVYYENNLDSDFDYTPSLFDVMDMQKGKYLDNQKKNNNKNPANGLSKANRNISFTLGGYMEAEISFNYENGEWEIFILNGGFNAGGGVSYDWNYNTFVGPVPVTGQFTVGATAEVIFKAAVQGGEQIKLKYDEDTVNNYLTTLRIYAYIRAFAGIGFDYSVAALKIGLFGQISVDAQFAFLNQPHISSTAVSGRRLDVRGRAGVEFVAKFLFVSYEKILASIEFDLYGKSYGKWNDIQKTWEDIKKGSSGKPGILSYEAIPMPDGSVMYPVSEEAIIEDRDYLSEFDRSWITPSRFGLFSLDPENGIKDLETNSYPYSNPVLSSDGKLLLYVSDANSTKVEDTQIRWSKMNSSGSYPNGTPVETASESFGDSQLKLSGEEDFAAAVWVMQNQSMVKEAGEPITNNDLALMSNSTEIMVGIYNGTSWITKRLTNNSIPDMAPAVATNGNQVLVAWRNVYASDSTNPLNFDGKDSILYSIYDGTDWTEPQTLYNGTSGAVKGLETAMLKDGTSAVTYTIDTEGFEADAPQNSQGVASSLETVYAIVDTNGDVVKNVRMTNDTYLDENPQIEAVMFDDDVERFVLGWYSLQDADGVSTNDIRLCAFDKNGALYNNFIDSISSVNANTVVNISRNFRFAKNAQSIDDLSILWTESENAGIDEDGNVLADKDLLKAVKFMNENGRIYITSVLDVATMDDFTLIDHFDVYNSGENEIKAVILGTDYGTGYKETPIKVVENGVIQDKTISTPKSISGLYTATGTYENKVEITSVAVDYKSVIRGTQIPVQFTVFNAGIEPINALTIKIGDDETTINTNFLMLPNESKILTVYYDVPSDKVINPDYTVTATFGEIADFGFGKGMKAVASTDSESLGILGFGILGETDTKSGTLYLNIPDVGISKLEFVSEDKGKRTIQVTLYNDSDIELTGSNRKVKIGFYEDLDCTILADEVLGQDSESNTVFEVSPADLSMIDAGAYTKQFTFDIKEFVGEDEEIPDSGIRLYAKAWIEEPVSGGTDTILEYNQNNNYSSVLFESPIKLNDGKPVTISTEKTDIAGITKATVTVKNNSLFNVTSGNIIVNLLDEDGKVIESLQSYDKLAANSGLITLMGEETAQRTFTFSQKGSSITVSYSNAILDKDNNTNLTEITLDGIPLQFEKGKANYTVTVTDLKETIVKSVTEDPNAKIIINGVEGTFGTAKIKLNYGSNVISIVVKAADGITTKTYTIRINNIDPSKSDDDNDDSDNQSEKAVVFSPNVTAKNGTATVTMTDADVAGLLNRANETDTIIIAPIITGAADNIIFDISASALTAIVNAGIGLSLETPLFNVILDLDALSDIIGGGAENISISIEQKNGLYSLRINRDGMDLSNISGGVTAYVNTPDAGSGLVAVLVNNVESALVPVALAGKFAGVPMKEPTTPEIIKMSIVKSGKMIVPLAGSATFKLIDNSKSFTDTKGHGSYIDFVTARNLFYGTGQNTFSPDLSMNRSMLVAVLGRLGDIDVSGFAASKFIDVNSNAYYAPYISWAAQNGIVHGVGGNRFLPEQAITREQLATIIVNYINFTGLKLSNISTDTISFADENEISPYAKEAVMTMKKAGIIYGKSNNRFDPKGTATRAEVAAMLERLVKNIER